LSPSKHRPSTWPEICGSLCWGAYSALIAGFKGLFATNKRERKGKDKKGKKKRKEGRRNRIWEENTP